MFICEINAAHSQFMFSLIIKLKSNKKIYQKTYVHVFVLYKIIIIDRASTYPK
jgi:hypothetical protein